MGADPGSMYHPPYIPVAHSVACTGHNVPHIVLSQPKVISFSKYIRGDEVGLQGLGLRGYRVDDIHNAIGGDSYTYKANCLPFWAGDAIKGCCSWCFFG